MAKAFAKLTILLLIVVTKSASCCRADEIWNRWENLRWEGICRYREANYKAAEISFKRALTEAGRVQPGGKNEATSTFDRAQVYFAEGNYEQAERYCKLALQNKYARSSSDSALITLILDSLANIKSGEGQFDEVRKLDEEADKRVDASPDAGTIGVATMERDGTLKLDLRANENNVIGHGIVICAPSDPDYKKVLMYLGPMKPGDHKLVAHWP